MTLPKWIEDLSKKAGQPMVVYSEEKVSSLTEKYIVELDKIISDRHRKKGYFKDIVKGYLRNYEKVGEFKVSRMEFKEMVNRISDHFENEDNLEKEAQTLMLTPGQERILPQVQDTVEELRGLGMGREEIKEALPEYVTFLRDSELFDLFEKIYPEE